MAEYESSLLLLGHLGTSWQAGGNCSWTGAVRTSRALLCSQEGDRFVGSLPVSTSNRHRETYWAELSSWILQEGQWKPNGSSMEASGHFQNFCVEIPASWYVRSNFLIFAIEFSLLGRVPVPGIGWIELWSEYGQKGDLDLANPAFCKIETTFWEFAKSR